MYSGRDPETFTHFSVKVRMLINTLNHQLARKP
jgi:hypothetical protein